MTDSLPLGFQCGVDPASWATLLIVLGVAVLVIISVIAERSWSNPDSTPSGDSATMPRESRWFLVVYLIGSGVTLVYLITKLYTVDFPETPFVIEVPAQGPIAVVPQPSEPAAPGTTGSQSAAAKTGTTLAPVLLHVFPQSTFGATPTVELALYGRNFHSAARVRFNHRVRGSKNLDSNLIRVVPEPSDLIGVGLLMVEVENPDKKVSNAHTLAVVRPRMPLWVFGRGFCIGREVQLILLVLCAGALGSYVHAVQSLADFIGNRTLTASWFWWYITRPFLGMALALIFYAVLRGGFLTGTPADVRVVNPFGAIAVAALVGMFADRAAQKLAEVFDALFKADDQRGGKLAGPTIVRLEPGTVLTGAPKPPQLRILGDRLGKASIRVDGTPRPSQTVSDKEIVLQLTPDDVRTSRTISISVVNPDGTVSPSLTLQVSDLEVTAKTLQPGQVGTDYATTGERVSATGGSGGYKWSAKGADWLQIDPGTGALRGTPTAPGTAKLEVTVTDTANVSANREFDLQIV